MIGDNKGDCCFRKSATNGLNFFVRYDNMYCSDVQMSLTREQMERGAGADGRGSILLCCEKESFAGGTVKSCGSEQASGNAEGIVPFPHNQGGSA